MSIGTDKVGAIRRARRLYEERCAQLEADTLWDLSGRLRLREPTVRKVWDNEVTMSGYRLRLDEAIRHAQQRRVDHPPRLTPVDERRVAAVRRLHEFVWDMTPGSLSEKICTEDHKPYPCPTIQALDQEER